MAGLSPGDRRRFCRQAHAHAPGNRARAAAGGAGPGERSRKTDRSGNPGAAFGKNSRLITGLSRTAGPACRRKNKNGGYSIDGYAR